MYKSILIILVLMLFGEHITYAQPNQNYAAEKPEKFSAIEKKIIDTIIRLPEVENRERYVKMHTNGKRQLQCTIWEKPTGKTPYYWVKVMEDNGTAYYTHFNFFVYTKPFLINFFDTVNDKAVDLKTWRKSKDNDL